MESGYIKFYRKIREHWIWEDPVQLKWWLDLVFMVNYEPKRIPFGNGFKIIEVGEHHTSEVKLAKHWDADRRTVDKFLKRLEIDEMITLKKSRQHGTTIKILNYKAYQVFLGDEKNNEMNIFSPSKAHQNVHKEINKEINNTLCADSEKKESERKTKKVFIETDTAYKLSMYMLDFIREFKQDFKQPNIQSWCVDMDRLIRIDNRSPNEVWALMKVVYDDTFWRSNILCPSKLREKYDQLIIKFGDKQNNKQ